MPVLTLILLMAFDSDVAIDVTNRRQNASKVRFEAEGMLSS